MYYYFWKDKKILSSAVPVPSQFNPSVEQLTAEQVEFYLAHPGATVQEVRNCAITPPYVPPTPDIAEYAAQKIKELKDVCLGSITVSTIEYAMANACLAGTTLVYSGKQHYTTAQARSVMKTFMDESDHAMTVYETYSTQIEAASTIEGIDTLYEQAIAAL